MINFPFPIGRLKSILLLLALTISTTHAEVPPQMQQLLKHFKTVAQFDHKYPREKVYLHLDNNAYYEDDIIWFKAYVVRASSLIPTTLSRVLYVELLKDDGSLIERKQLPIDEKGQASGSFQLELPIQSGFHEIRAYTREMVNWGEEACFSRVVPTFNKPTSKRSKSLRLDDINSETLNIDLPADTKRNAHLTTTAAGKTLLSFFPEGGHRVAGVPQRIAFLLTDGRGAKLAESLTVHYPDGRVLDTVECEHEGMGCILLPADFGNGGYVKVNGKQFPLPDTETQQHYAMQVEPEEEGVAIYVSPSPLASQELLGLAIHCRDKVCYFDTLTAYNEPVGLYVPYTALHGGVNRIELFNSEGRGLCKRLIWKSAPERELNLHIRQNQKTYKAFSPVALDMQLEDKEGKPVAATFSLAVRDSEGDLAGNHATSTNADLLLSSELKGYVHHPDFYFEKDDAAHRRALDLLLLVQGWSANSFETLCGQQSFQLKQPIEEKLTLNGIAYKDNDKREPYPFLQLKLNMYSKSGGNLVAEATTDKNGRFAFVSNVDYEGDWMAHITTKNAEGEKEWSRVAFDRWFSPKVRPLTFSEIQLEVPMPRQYDSTATATEEQDFFEWNDTVSDKQSIVLGTAVVKAKKKYKGFTGNRYTYNGGEKAGMRQAENFFNVEMEVERYKDMGYAPDTFIRFLPFLSKDFSTGEQQEADDAFIENDNNNIAYNENRSLSEEQEKTGVNGAANDHTLSVAYTTFRGEPIATYLNNGTGAINAAEINVIKAEEVKSAVVVKGANIKRLVDHDFGTSNSGGFNDYYALFVYELPNAALYRSKKGIMKRRVWGYAQPKLFFHPNYAETDVPSSKDVRRTLYWNPSVTTDDMGKASVVFFTNSREEVELRITARGVSADGRMIDADK